MRVVWRTRITQVPEGTVEKPQFSQDTAELPDTVITGSFKEQKRATTNEQN